MEHLTLFETVLILIIIPVFIIGFVKFIKQQ
jgi:hypothetical protein